MKKLIPADTVDIDGTVWGTICENILGTTGVTGSAAARMAPNFSDSYADHPVIRMFKRIT